MRLTRLAIGSLLAGCAVPAEPAEDVTPPAPSSLAQHAWVRAPSEADPAAAESDPVPPEADPPVAEADPAAAEAGPADAAASDAGTAMAPCPESIDDLRASAVYDADDRRLRAASLVVVDKSARRLLHFKRGKLDTCWRAALGFSPKGHKRVEGDGRTPEGWYRTSDKPWSSFKRAIAVHYPNAQDARRARADGRIGRRTAQNIVTAAKKGRVPPQRTAMGGAILIHGGGSRFDWTAGCVALDDDDLVELRERLPAGKRTNLLVLP